MRRRVQLRFSLLLAALVLCAGLVPAGAAGSTGSSSAVVLPRISTELQPGWNMIGWVGPATSSGSLFQQLPELERISEWDADRERYWRALRGEYEQLPTLTAGMGLWLLIGGDAPVRWDRPIALEGADLRLSSGLNLVGWTGDDGTPVREALQGLGDAVLGTWGWDAAEQQYVHYNLRSSGAVRTQLDLRRGAALWVEVADPVAWLQPAADPPVVFLGEVPAHIKGEIIAEYERVQTFFAERFGVVPRETPLYVGADVDAVRATHLAVFGRPPLQPNCARFIDDNVDVVLASCALPVHLLGLDDRQVGALLTQGDSIGDPGGADWIVIGTELYIDFLYQPVAGSVGYDRNRRAQVNQATRATIPLRSLDTVSQRPGDRPDGAHAVAFLAVERLAALAGDPAIFEYYRLLPLEGTWESAFGEAFGTTVDEFYTDFEAYRQELASLLPHVTDEGTRPVIEFVGELPAEAREAIRSDFERVGEFVSRRFDTKPREFTLYVGPDVDTLRAEVPVSFIGLGGWNGCSGFVERDVAIVSLAQPCGPSTRQDIYYIKALLPRYPSPPVWMGLGAEEYATAAYHAEAKGLDIAEHRASLIKWARLSLGELRDLEAAQSLSGITRALSYFAVEWLVERTGEPALFDFFEQWSPYEDWKPVFEATFGISVEDFYEEFEAYRAELFADER